MANPISRVQSTSQLSSKMAANLEAKLDGTYILSVGVVGRGRWHSLILTFDELAELMEPVHPAAEAQADSRYEIRRSPRSPKDDLWAFPGPVPTPWYIAIPNEDEPVSWHSTHIEAVLEVERLLKEGKA